MAAISLFRERPRASKHATADGAMIRAPPNQVRVEPAVIWAFSHNRIIAARGDGHQDHDDLKATRHEDG
jgi:hypothetical protein